MKLRSIRAATLATLCWLCAAGGVSADDTDTNTILRLQDENLAMRQQLAAQEERIARLEKAGGAPVQGGAGLLQASDGEARFDISLTGFLKTDLLWNDSRVNSTSAPRFAASGGDGDDQFSATIQHSRFILKLRGPKVGDGRMRGYAELDLFNILNDLNVNNNLFRVRQLYFAVDQPTWSIVAGQTWDLFSPLNVGTLNTNGNYWFGGNAGFRRPQVQARKRFGLGSGGSTLTAAASVNTNVGEIGRDAGSPVVEASLELALPGLLAGPIRLGASGLWGEEELDAQDFTATQWGVGGHLVVPLTKWAKLLGEIQHGENLDAFLMGAGVGVNPVTEGEVSSTSGWAQLSLDLREGTSINAFFGLDDPDDTDLAGIPNPQLLRTRNLVWGLNLEQRLYSQLLVGLEFQRFDTRFLGASSQQSNLIWMSGMMYF